MAATKSLLNTPPDITPNTHLTVNGVTIPAHLGEPLIDALNRHTRAAGKNDLPQVCYLAQMGPIQSCDTCMVEVNGQLTRACSIHVTPGIAVNTEGELIDIAQREAFDRILQN